VSIGSKATIGFHSFVNRDVSDGATVAGVPAREIGSRKEDG
jgi:serine acetyltransferase